jgi:hypothetical protein
MNMGHVRSGLLLSLVWTTTGRLLRSLIVPLPAQTQRPERIGFLVYSVVGAENLRDQAVFVNHAAGPITPLDPELIEIRDAVGQLP